MIVFFFALTAGIGVEVFFADFHLSWNDDKCSADFITDLFHDSTAFRADAFFFAETMLDFLNRSSFRDYILNTSRTAAGMFLYSGFLFFGGNVSNIFRFVENHPDLIHEYKVRLNGSRWNCDSTSDASPSIPRRRSVYPQSMYT